MPRECGGTDTGGRLIPPRSHKAPNSKTLSQTQAPDQGVEAGEAPDGLSNRRLGQHPGADCSRQVPRLSARRTMALVSSNPAQGWRIRYAADGTISPDAARSPGAGLAFGSQAQRSRVYRAASPGSSLNKLGPTISPSPINGTTTCGNGG